MNIFIYSLVIFVLAYLVLKLLARMNTKRLSKIVRSFIVIFSLILAILFALGGKFLLSFPLILISLGILKLKGLTLFQLFNLYRLIRVLQNSGRFSFNKFNQPQTTVVGQVSGGIQINTTPKGATIILDGEDRAGMAGAIRRIITWRTVATNQVYGEGVNRSSMLALDDFSNNFRKSCTNTGNNRKSCYPCGL